MDPPIVKSRNGIVTEHHTIGGWYLIDGQLIVGCRNAWWGSFLCWSSESLGFDWRFVKQTLVIHLNYTYFAFLGPLLFNIFIVICYLVFITLKYHCILMIWIFWYKSRLTEMSHSFKTTSIGFCYCTLNQHDLNVTKCYVCSLSTYHKQL